MEVAFALSWFDCGHFGILQIETSLHTFSFRLLSPCPLFLFSFFLSVILHVYFLRHFINTIAIIHYVVFLYLTKALV